MFEQITKAFQDAGAGPFIRASQEAAATSQKHVAKAIADVTEYAQMEMANAVAIASSHKPEQAVHALTNAVKNRQEFVTRKTKEMIETVTQAGAEMTRLAETKTYDFASQANTVVDTAFANAKQGLGVAENVAKSVVAKATKARK